MQIKSAKDLIVYQKAYARAMEIFGGTQRLSRKEKVITCRSNPAFLSVCLYKSATGMGKTQVRSALCEKLTDADGENGQTDAGSISLTTAVICRNAIMRSSLKNVVKSEQRSAVLPSFI